MAILNPTLRRSAGRATRLIAATATLLVAVPVAAVQLQEAPGPRPDVESTQLKGVVLLSDTRDSLVVGVEGYKLFKVAPKAAKRGRAVDRALVEAAGDGDVEGVNDLLAAGANVDAAIDGDGSPLIAAAREGQLAIVRLLLDRGADPNMTVDRKSVV